MFEILKWKLFFQNAFVGCHYLSVCSLKMDTKNATPCRVPFHDSMPSFMNFRRVLDLLEFENQASQCFAAINGALVFEFIPISCMGPKHAPKDRYLIFQPIYMHWSMRM